MPTVLRSGRGKLCFGPSLHRCLFPQETTGQHGCAKDIWGDMTQPWPSQRALAGDQRILFNPTDGKQPPARQRQGRGDALPPTNRHPRVAPHKSMLVDDLKLSSDEDDVQRATDESASWDRHSPSHTNGRRARNTSSDSSRSRSSAESVSGSLRSRSSSPPASPRDGRSPRGGNKESDRPTAAQWQLDKWLKKSKKKAAGRDRSIPGNPPSPHTLRAPSPARCWDSSQDYRPSQSPIPSPQLSYRPDSPLLSPGYSFCPSPLSGTCPSPSISRYSPGPSPVSSVFPSLCGSPRTQRSPDPIQRDPQGSPTPSPSQYYHYPEVQSHLYSAPPPRKTKVRSVSNSKAKTKHTNSTEPPLHQHRPKARPTEDKDHRQNKSKAVSNSSDSCRPQSSSHSVTKKPAKDTSHYELIQGGRHGLSSDRKTQPPVRHASQHNTARTKHHLPTARETGISQSSTARASGNNHLRPGPDVQPWARPSAVNANPFKTSDKPLQAKKREVRQREGPHTEGEGRKDKRREDRHRDEERKEDKRLAEAQLLRRRWIESSAEEEEGDVVAVEGKRRRPREEQQIRESQTIQSKEQHRHHDHARQQRGGEKEVNRGDTSSPPSPPPQRRSPSPSASSNSDSEYQVAKVPADSTSLQSLRQRAQHGCGRPDGSKSRGTHSKSPAEGQQSEDGHKLYTLVPFGRSEQATVPSQRGLRNLVVHIDLCLLKRVPDTSVHSTVKATDSASSSSSSSTTKGKQAKAMKHLYTPETVSKDTRRKRKGDQQQMGEAKRRHGSLSEEEENSAVLRRHVMNELLETERAYVEELLCVLQGYASEMDNASMAHLIPAHLQNKKEVLFGNMPEIYHFHKRTFLRELELYADCPELVGRCFLQRMTDLQIYEKYCHNKPRSESLWRQCSDCVFFQECQKKLEHKLGLDSYLLKPVQRITKYQLLLKEMLKYSKGCEGTEDLQEALTSILGILKAVNDSMHLIAITGYEGNLSDLGKLLMQGSFSVWTEHKKGHAKVKDLARFKPMQRHIFLHEKALLFCKRREESGEGYEKAPSYSFKQSLSMNAVGITENAKGDNKKFEIWCNSREEVYIVQAPTAEVKTTWVKEIRKVLTTQLEACREASQQRAPEQIGQCPPVAGGPENQSPLKMGRRSLKKGDERKAEHCGLDANSSPSPKSAVRERATSPTSDRSAAAKKRFTLQGFSNLKAQKGSPTSPDHKTKRQSDPTPFGFQGWNKASLSMDASEEHEGYSSGEDPLNSDPEDDSGRKLCAGKYTVTGDHEKASPGEVAVKAGDAVKLVKEGEDGQWLVRNLNTSAEGWMASAHLLNLVSKSKSCQSLTSSEGSGSGHLSTSSSCSETCTPFTDAKS